MKEALSLHVSYGIEVRLTFKFSLMQNATDCKYINRAWSGSISTYCMCMRYFS